MSTFLKVDVFASSYLDPLPGIPDNQGKPGSHAGEYVEPVQLQVVCQTLWRVLPLDVTEIGPDELAVYGNVHMALMGFYERAVKETSEASGVDEGDLRRWFSDQLITTVGTRGTVFQAGFVADQG